jgi:hypothetical protein
MTNRARQLVLSTQGLRNIESGDEVKDFDFVVGKVHHHCPWFIAEFLSPRIAELRRSDNTICEFFIETADPRGEFCRFLSLGEGESISIDCDNQLFYEELSEELKNLELFNVLLEGRGDSMTIDEAFSRLRRRNRLNFDCSREINFLASHLYEIEISSRRDFDISMLRAILSSDELKIKSEDWLYDELWSLLEFVSFQHVSPDVAGRFIASSHDFLNLLTSSVWFSLGRRFVEVLSLVKPTSRLAVCGRGVLRGGDKLKEGVITYLAAKCGGNVHDKGVIEASSNSVHCDNLLYHARNAVDLQNHTSSSEFLTKNEPNSWICYDFKDMKMVFTHYSIIPVPYGANRSNHPRSWCIRVSMNGSEWTEVHRCDDNQELNGRNHIGTWSVYKRMTCRYIRFRQTGKNYYNNDFLRFSGFEVFGVLQEP